ncbi:MAG: hypothetical protein HYT87_02115 [Nitrospirae bacterium]|nr:hypothetical protein [Nitrospirota bacterium]
MPHDEWKLSIIADASEPATGEFHVRLYRQRGSWYDEIRFDSHELRKGRKIFMPHVHVKMQTAVMDSVGAAAKARTVAGEIAPLLEGILKR